MTTAQHAVNVCDLTKDDTIAQFLVAPVIQGRQLVDCEPGRMDGGGVLLECDEKRADAIVQVIRLKHHKNLLRCYKKTERAKRWKRV